MDKNTKRNNWDRAALHCCTGVIHDKKGWQQRTAGFKCNAYYPTKKLLSSFTVTREMREYLGLDDIELNPGKAKRKDNTIFESCKQSPATKRILWFYGCGELPAI